MQTIILLGFVSLLADISSEMVYPLLPVFFVTTLGASPALLGVVEGIAESLASIVKVFSGYSSDRMRRRLPFAIGGYAFSALGKLLVYASSGWGSVLAGRSLDRFGKGMRGAPRDALIAEQASVQRRGEAFGLHRMMDTLGAVAGVAISYFLFTRLQGDLRRVILWSVFPAAAAVGLLFFVREKQRTAVSRNERFSFRWGTLDARLKSFLIVAFIFALGNSSNQFLLLRAKSSGVSVAGVILMYLVYNISYAFTSFPAGKLSDRIGRRAVLVTGYAVYAFVYLGFALARTRGAFWPLFVLYGVYTGFTEGVEKALIADIAPPQLRATAIGFHATLVGAGLLPASILAGVLFKYMSASAPFYFGSLMGFVACGGLWWVLRTSAHQTIR